MKKYCSNAIFIEFTRYYCSMDILNSNSPIKIKISHLKKNVKSSGKNENYNLLRMM